MTDKTIKFQIRMTQDEYNKMARDASMAGLNLSSYIRALISGKTVVERPSMDLVDILKALGKIGNNMNQIAAQANAKGFVDTAAYWENAEAVNEATAKLLEVMYP